MKSVYEANVGVKLSKKESIWIDAGILPSHIGFESAIGQNCPSLTRSILAENSPYFETGARLSYNSRNNHWYMAALLLNGWQRISMNNGNTLPSFGHQLTFKPNDRLLFNSSSFIGNDKPDSLRKFRIFHDLYVQYKIAKNLSLVIACDVGAEQKTKGSSSYNCWYAPIFLGKIILNKRSPLGCRAEYYNDKNGVIISSNTPNGPQIWGYSVNYDLWLSEKIMWRVEAREFNSDDRQFSTENAARKDDLLFTSSLSFSF